MELLTRALETMAWCALYADPQNIQHSLRSSALQPIGNLASWYYDPTAFYGLRSSPLDGTPGLAERGHPAAADRGRHSAATPLPVTGLWLDARGHAP